MTPFASAAARRRFLRTTAFVVCVAVVCAVALRLFAPDLTDPDRLRAAFLALGPAASVAFVAFAAAGVVIAPVPGQAVAFLGGYLFGPVRGTLYTLVGFTLGSVVAFGLARRFGRPFVERTFAPALVDRFDGFVGEAGVTGVFVVFLLPGLPDDVICFSAGLTRVPLRWLVAAALVGRTPGIALVALAGASVETGATTAALGLLATLLALTLVGWRSRERLLDALRSRP